jgi:glycosyltransferase involved in cell wall biosynthesis
VYQRYGLWSAATLEIARRLGVPSVLEINAPLLAEQAEHRELHDPAGAEQYTRRVLAAATAPFAVSGPVARWASTTDPGRRAIPVVPNGVDVERFTPGPVRHGTPPVVAFSGTFKPWHGLDLLVDSVVAADADLRLLLIGDGPELDRTLRRTAWAGMRVVATGQVNPRDVPALLRMADLAVAPYPAGTHYFSPLKLAEYLAAGLPTVASAIADVPHLVAANVEALLVPPGDVAATAAALRRLARDPDLRARLGSAGRAAALRRFSWSAAVDASLALLPATAGAVA